MLAEWFLRDILQELLTHHKLSCVNLLPAPLLDRRENPLRDIVLVEYYVASAE
jgi:hypothetical protein